MEEKQQINNCIDEITKLKEKMEALEKQNILNEKNEMIKKTTMEPNLKVLENWLVDYKNALQIKEQKELEKKLRVEEGGWNWNVKDEKNLKKKIINDINQVKEDVYKNIGSYSYVYNNEPTEVMEAHIEATYNMFNIINKRLDDIEKKIGINN